GAPRVFVLSGALVTAGNIPGAYDAPVANFFVAGNDRDRGGGGVAAGGADGGGPAEWAGGSGGGARRAGGGGPRRGAAGRGRAGERARFQDLAAVGGGVLEDGVYVG